MGHKKFLTIKLAILLVMGGIAISACTTGVSDVSGIPSVGPSIPSERNVLEPSSQGIRVDAQQASDWEQVNVNGFGDPKTGEVTALESFNGYLYAGIHHPVDPAQLIDGAQIFRSSDGITWIPVTQPGFGNSHDIAPPAILDFIVFNNRLYAGTGRGNASQIWRTSNGTIWAPMDVTGFSDPDNVDVTSLAIYNGMIYAGVMNQVTGAQIWRSFTGDNNSWTQDAPVVPGTAPASITGFAELGIDGGLYAAVESEAPAQVWRSYGSGWEVIVNDGFGDANTLLTGGMAEFGGYLYVGAGNTASGALLWRTNDGATWEQAITPGFGDPNNQKIEAVSVFQNQLYAGVQNTVTGMEIWRSPDSVLWEQVNLDGFGDSNNTTTNGRNATASFLGQLYVGTLNIIDGGELWRKLEPFPDTPTPTSTNTPTTTPSSTSTVTPTGTATITLTNTPTSSPTNTPSNTPTDTATSSPLITVTSTPSITFTSTATDTPTNTPTPTPRLSTPGKVTGGGNIDLASGKATFGFVVRYDAGAARPSGNLTFMDHSTKLSMKAESFDLLVIEGDQVWITGTGVMDNGQISKFEIVIDLAKDTSSKPDQPDAFYITIPAMNGYGFGGVLSGGNITVHE